MRSSLRGPETGRSSGRQSCQEQLLSHPWDRTPTLGFSRGGKSADFLKLSGLF